MPFVFPPPPVARVATIRGDFPVHRIYCVGRNYAAHAREMGNDERDPPFFFMKPADAVVPDGAVVPYPPATHDLHFEAELVVAIGKGGADISREKAGDHVWGYGAGIDLTRRDLQALAKKAARPWDMAKGFDHSAPCASLVPAGDATLPGGHADNATLQGSIRLWRNEVLCQNADLSEMIWPVPDIIAHLSALVTLQPGDLIYTGTPAGVGPTRKGDSLRVEIDGLPPLSVRIG